MILAPTKWSPRWHSNAKKWPKYGWTVEQIKVLWEATFSRKWQAAVFVGYWGMVRLRINEIEPLHKRMGHSGCLWGWLCATSDLLHHIVGWGWPHHNITRHDDRLFQSTHASSFTAHCLALNHWCHYPDSHTKPLQVMPSNWEHANILFLFGKDKFLWSGKYPQSSQQKLRNQQSLPANGEICDRFNVSHPLVTSHGAVFGRTWSHSVAWPCEILMQHLEIARERCGETWTWQALHLQSQLAERSLKHLRYPYIMLDHSPANRICYS